MLIASRFLQGVGGAGASAVIVAIIVTEFPEPAERARAMSVYTLAAVGGGSIGLLLGGILTESVNWHWIFFVNLPVGLATMVAGVRAASPRTRASASARGVDWLGSLLVTGAMMLGVYAILTAADHGWGSAHTLGFGAAAVVVLAALRRARARASSNPMLPASVLRTPGLLGGSFVRGLLMVVGMFGSFFVGSLFLERVLGYGAVQTGTSFLPQTHLGGDPLDGDHRRADPALRRPGAPRPRHPHDATVGLVLLALAGAGTAFFPQLFFAFALLGIGLGIGVHAADDDRHGRRARARRGSRLRDPQRLDAGRRRASAWRSSGRLAANRTSLAAGLRPQRRRRRCSAATTSPSGSPPASAALAAVLAPLVLSAEGTEPALARAWRNVRTATVERSAQS